MRRIALAVVAGIALTVLIVATAAGGEDGGSYLVRGYFDNGSFIVNDEDVRVGGANVGSIEDVEVSLPGERVSNKEGKEVQPGTAVVVMRIEDEGFRDFREDASCVIRIQSLIGERFVDCETTLPRAAGSEAPPELEEIPDGEPGEGQRLLPLEQNGNTVDIDLINNINRKPFADRFRIILSELGATFASRGEDLAEIVERFDPTLREGNKVLEILADQRKQLNRLNRDSDQILGPLANARRDVSGFFDNAGVAAEPTAERRAELEESLARFPGFLRELRSTMTELGSFSETATPVLDQLGIAAPEYTRATEALEPFAEGSTKAIRSLGEAAEEAGPPLVEADTVVKRTRDLALSGRRPTKDLKRFLGSTERTGGFEGLMDLIYNTGGSVNGFDEFGHFLRAKFVPTVDCLRYEESQRQARGLGACRADYGRFGVDDSVERIPRGRGGASSPSANAEADAQAAKELSDFLFKP